jgi:ATP adenylyltransferase
MLFKKGTLWDSIVKTADQALTIGALLPVATDYTFIEDAGMRFFVRIQTGLKRKDEAKKKQEAESKAGRNTDPFLQPEKELTVADISQTHLAVLNKFNVANHHLLIITRDFEDQDMLLTQKDFEALWLCMAEYNSLGFYNGGREAGASQQHKHLQMVPLPLAPSGPAIPVEPLLAAAPVIKVGTVPGFPFLHSFARLDRELVNSPLEAAKKAYELYSAMLAGVGMTPPKAGGLTPQSMPYCFLATRGWMLLVPRSREFFEDISLNSLAFAGSLFVRNEQQLEAIRKHGPLKALASAAAPKNA